MRPCNIILIILGVAGIAEVIVLASICGLLVLIGAWVDQVNRQFAQGNGVCSATALTSSAMAAFLLLRNCIEG